jgi:hypothetical protein
MKVVVLIEGREAVPVRALPYVTGWNLSPDALAKDLAKHGERENRRGGLRAFQFDPDDNHPPITPNEWDHVVVALEALDWGIRYANGGETDVHTYQRWRAASPSHLPGACFVWRDEFEAEYQAGHTSVASDDNDELPPLNFSPLIPHELRDVVMEGFPAPTGVKASASDHGKWPWGAYETKLLRDLAEAAERFWVRYDPADTTTAPTNEDVIAWLEDRGVSNNLAKAIASILRAEGLPPGPRK